MGARSPHLGSRATPNTHEWHVLAAGAARLLDPNVAFLERLAAVVHPSIRCVRSDGPRTDAFLGSGAGS